ncbi:MAG: FAD-dependent oxidoreductase, partial [Caldilineaceae bacterium]|nr:FAD-dependent oxidoreductase [Caldilineaceae bacterium]
MKRANGFRIILYLLFGLLLSWSTVAKATAQSGAATAPDKRQSTRLITVGQLVTHDDAKVTMVRLVTGDGQPVAGATIQLSGSEVPTEEVVTGVNGEAHWQFPSHFPHGQHIVKLLFAGTENLQPAIAVLKIDLRPGTAGALAKTGNTRYQLPAIPTMAPVTSAQQTQYAALRTAHHLVPAATQPIRGPTQAAATVVDQSWVNVVQSWTLTYIIPLRHTMPPALPLLLGICLLAIAVAPAGYFVRQRLLQRRKTQLAIPAEPRVWQLPLTLWYGIRFLSVSFAISIAIVLFVRPAVGLTLFWRILIPLLPLLFFVAPGLWRNICPMAALNQTPRLFHFTRAWNAPRWFQRNGYLIAITLFVLLVASRKVIFNENGPALAILILCALASALVMGFLFKGKSGWCSSICPLLPVQRIYGQTPFVTVGHAHCEPCLGCTKNCYDLSPHHAYLADLYDEEPNFARFREAFVGFFPGFVLAFYLVPNPPAIAPWQVYGLLLGSGALTMGLLLFALTVAKALNAAQSSNKVTVLFGATALNLYYWFNAPTLGSWFGGQVADEFAWALRTLVFGLTLFWIYRTYRKEAHFREFHLTPVTQHGTIRIDPLPGRAGEPGGHQTTQPTTKPRLTIAPEGTCLTVDKNRTLLELCEAHNLPIEAGCRMGLCGADPVCVLDGMENLSRISEEERKTLERLGLAPNTRMACMARVRGDVKVALTPERPDIYRSSVITGFRYDKAVQRVVIVGNGIAGVTAADHIRRRHPHCEIHLIGRERYHLYNRMGITRLIYGRSAMQGLMLLPEQWYEDFNITCWLNTQVQQVDAKAQTVTLG